MCVRERAHLKVRCKFNLRNRKETIAHTEREREREGERGGGRGSGW